MTFDTEIIAIKKEVHPDLKLKKEVKTIIGYEIIKQIETIDSWLQNNKEKGTDKIRDVIDYSMEELPESITQSYMNNIVKMSDSDKELIISERKIKKYMNKKYPSYIYTNTSILMEYIVSEILESAGNMCLLNKKKIITLEHMNDGVDDDDDLKKM